jgi:hypothetical protein
MEDGAGDLRSAPKERKVSVGALIDVDVVVDRGARPTSDLSSTYTPMEWRER